MQDCTCATCHTSLDSQDLPLGPDGAEYCPVCAGDEFEEIE